MNGIHDMGGMHGFGPVEHEANEPVFHEPWEGREVGIRNVIGMADLFHGGPGFRYAIETLDPVYYLATPYYERHLQILVDALINKGLISAAELEQRVEDLAKQPGVPLPRVDNPAKVELTLKRMSTRPVLERGGVEPRFRPGDAIRARNFHPVGHTRLPRYVRGKRGFVDRLYGVHDFPDWEPGQTKPLPPQPLYSVRFDMQEVWGESAEPGESLYIDMWESYLEPASK